MKFTAVPISAFDKIQINAGIVLKNFDPVTGAYQQSDIIGLTTGGNNFQPNPTYTDFGDDVNNVPANNLDEDDFDDLWLVGDYSNKNGATNGGFCAIHIKHALNTGGFVDWYKCNITSRKILYKLNCT